MELGSDVAGIEGGRDVEVRDLARCCQGEGDGTIRLLGLKNCARWLDQQAIELMGCIPCLFHVVAELL
jgi:hypothetical protein